MDAIETLGRCLDHLRATATQVPDDRWDVVTNCPPWTADTLLGHIVASQRLWLSAIDGQERATVADVMNPVPLEGDRLAEVDDTITEALAVWSAPGVLDRDIAGAFGTLPGADTIVFPSIDALAHTWDLAVSTGLDPELPDDLLPVAEQLVARAVNDTTRSFNLFADPPELGDDATATDRVMAQAGRRRPG